MPSPRGQNRSLPPLLTRYLGFFCIWAQAIATCAVLAETPQGRLPVFRVDTQERTPHEVGAELGRQWKSAFPEFEAKLDALLAHRLEQIGFDGGVDGQPLPATRQYAPGGLTENHREELEGLASALYLVSRDRLGDGFLSRDELFLLQQLPDRGARDAGSAFGVYASRSETGSSLVGRNLDGQPRQERMERDLEAIVVYQGENKTLVNIGFAGNIGITTGFNQSGLLLAYLPLSDPTNQGVAEAASEPIGFTIRRMLEAHERIDDTAQALSWPIDGSNYSVLVADRDRVQVLEHAAGSRGRLRDPSSEVQPVLSWPHKEKIAVVGCFALSAMPSGCTHLRDQYRWKRFSTLADLDLRGTPFTIKDIVQIMLDQVGSQDAINAPTTYQTLAFAPGDAELYVGTGSPTASDSAEPLMHRYADLIKARSPERWGFSSVWLWLWLSILGIAIVTLWVRLRSPNSDATALDEGG